MVPATADITLSSASSEGQHQQLAREEGTGFLCVSAQCRVSAPIGDEGEGGRATCVFWYRSSKFLPRRVIRATYLTVVDFVTYLHLPKFRLHHLHSGGS